MFNHMTELRSGVINYFGYYNYSMSFEGSYVTNCLGNHKKIKCFGGDEATNQLGYYGNSIIFNDLDSTK